MFRPYAKFWLNVLLELILCSEFSSSDDADSTGINYFINDVLVTLLSWHPVAVPQVGNLQLAAILHMFIPFGSVGWSAVSVSCDWPGNIFIYYFQFYFL